ncbi:MAG: type III secretion system inner membrane ring subunit SctD [Arenicella sp.]
MKHLSFDEDTHSVEASLSHYVLKVLSGPHLGAELILSEGSYSIGKSDDCDLIFQDEMIRDNHARLRVHKSGLVITQLTEQPLLIEGEPTHKDTPQQLQEYQLITLGGTRMAIGRSGKGWEQVDKKLVLLAANGPLEHVVIALDNWLKKYFNRDSLDPNKVYITLALLVFMILALWLLSGPEKGYIPLSSDEQLTKVNDVLLQEKATDVNVSKGETGAIVLSGYTETELQISLINRQLTQNNISVELHLISAEYLADSFKDLAASLGFKQLVVDHAESGHISVSGYVSDWGQWQQSKVLLNRDIAGLQSIDDQQLEDITARSRAFKVMLAASELDKKLTLLPQVDKNQILVLGAINEQEVVRWSQVLKEFTDRFSENPKVVSKLDNTQTVLDMTLDAVYINGDERYVVFDKDKKYAQGESLENGYQLKDISLEKIILLSSDGREYEYLIQ